MQRYGLECRWKWGDLLRIVVPRTEVREMFLLVSYKGGTSDVIKWFSADTTFKRRGALLTYKIIY